MAITYTPTTNFGAKDSLPTNDPAKVIKGSEFTTEFTAIQTAFGLAAPAASPTFTGTVTIASVDINGGNIDGVTIGGSSAGAITGTTITGTSFVSSGDMTFGDNDKAIFGAGSDLQIYHDGSNSYISDQGTGNLRILGDEVLIANAANNEFKAVFNSNGAAALYYDGSAKLATTTTGIDVTGTVTADGLTVDTDTGITLKDGADTRTANLFLDGGAFQQHVTGSADIHFYSTDSKTLRMAITGNTGDISFYEDTGTTAKFFWDASAERLGIGTTSPTSRMTVKATGSSFADASFVLENYNTTDRTYLAHTGGKFYLSNDGSTTHMLVDASGNVGIGTTSITNVQTPTLQLGTNRGAVAIGTGDIQDNGSTLDIGSARPISFSISGSEKARIDSSGNVGIGTSSPLQALHVNSGTGNSAAIFESTDATSQIWIKDSGSSSTYQTGIACFGDNLLFNNGGERMRIDASGNVGIGTDSPSTQLHVNEASTNEAAFTLSNNDGTYRIGANNDFGLHFADSFKFANQADTTEYVRIDSSGVVYAGKSAQDISVVGHELHPTGFVFHTRNDAEVLYLRRNSSDGAIQNFYKDSTLVGSIGAFGGSLFVSGANSGVFFNGNGMEPTSGGSTRVDGTENIGASAYRFKDLYLSGGVYLGGTGAANKLDDYDEGSVTLSLGGSTSNPSVAQQTTAHYVKIGGLVTVYFKFSSKDNTGASGDVEVDGLPFVAANNDSYGTAWAGRDAAGTAGKVWQVEIGNSYLRLIDTQGNGVAWTSTGSGTFLGGTITYTAA